MGTRIIALLAFIIGFIGAGPSFAACTDPPSPGVDWRRCIHDRDEFRDARLEGAILRDASFNRADLSGADFTAIIGFRVKFLSAKLVGARFDAAKLSQADFTKADLSGASFVEADLRRAKLFRANLRGAVLTGAQLIGTDLLNADLSGATWTDGKRVCAKGSIGRCN
jgi:uncharacterized protein YjbI with pentapeptide repeats